MSYELTNDDKIAIINQHLKNLEYSKYNLEMTLLEENSSETPNKSVIDTVQEDIAEITAKQTALLAELEKVNP